MSREATGSDTLANECDDCGLSSGVVRLWCIIEKEGKKEEGDGFSLQNEELSTKRAEVTTVRVLPEARATNDASRNRPSRASGQGR